MADQPSIALVWLRTCFYVVVITALGVLAAIESTGWERVAVIALTATSVAAALVRGRYPYALLFVAWIATALATQVLLAPAVFTVGVHRRDKRSFAAIALTIALLGLVAPRGERLVSIDGIDLESLTAFGSWLLNAIVVVVVPYSIGLVLGVRRELIASYRLRAEFAEVERAARANEAVLLERARIAHEAHDILGHKLSLLTMQAGGLELNAGAGADVIEKQAQLIRQSARAALDDLRSIIGALEASDLPDTDQTLIPQDLLGIRKLIEASRSSGATVELITSNMDETDRLPESMIRAAYRIVQEGLTNAHRHAAGAPIIVSLAGSPGDTLTVEIRNTVDTTVGAGPSRSGRGLPGLRERVRLVGGTLEVENADAVFILRARLPWANSSSEQTGRGED
ncbi:sensor histidine kinase [Leifsonia aquatica]|uniref:sensor histidine kinase n=1 Tax=Leifsonia aquatica TaxID=144185 RepID=UPI00384B82F0